MYPIRFQTRISLVLVLLPALLLLGGCSLFGVATKGNLEDAVAAQEARDQQTAAQMAEISRDINEVEQQLNTTLSQLDNDVEQIRQSVLTAQLALQSVLVEMDALAISVDAAGQDSRMALDLQKETLVAERNRLRLRLQQLDDQIMSWQQTLPASTTPTRQQMRPSIVPEQPNLTDNQTAGSPVGGETSIWDRKR